MRRRRSSSRARPWRRVQAASAPCHACGGAATDSATNTHVPEETPPRRVRGAAITSGRRSSGDGVAGRRSSVETQVEFFFTRVKSRALARVPRCSRVSPHGLLRQVRRTSSDHRLPTLPEASREASGRAVARPQTVRASSIPSRTASSKTLGGSLERRRPPAFGVNVPSGCRSTATKAPRQACRQARRQAHGQRQAPKAAP